MLVIGSLAEENIQKRRDHRQREKRKNDGEHVADNVQCCITFISLHITEEAEVIFHGGKCSTKYLVQSPKYKVQSAKNDQDW